MSFFDFFDSKRAKFLKNSANFFAPRALELYSGGEGSFMYYCGAADEDDNDWDAFKNWVFRRFFSDCPDDGWVLLAYIKYLSESEDLTSERLHSIVNDWSGNGPSDFDKDSETSGEYWIFAAYAEALDFGELEQLAEELELTDSIDEPSSDDAYQDDRVESFDDPDSTSEELMKIKGLYENGLIDDEEYKALKKKALGL